MLLKKDRLLNILPFISAALMFLVFVVSVFGICFPQTVFDMMKTPGVWRVEPALKAILIISKLNYLLMAALAVISGLRKEFSLKWGIGTAVCTAVLWNSPGILGRTLINSIIAHLFGNEQLAIYGILENFSNWFSLFSSLAVLLFISCTAIEIYCAWKNKKSES